MDKENIEKQSHLLITLAKLASINWLDTNENPPPAATALAGELEMFIPLADFINKEEESNRLEREIKKLEKDLAFIEGKLQNPNFVDKAPADVVSKERKKQEEMKMLLAKFEKQRRELQ